MDDSVSYLYNVNGEKTLFHYQPNFLDISEINKLNIWLNSKKYKEGYCISGNEIPRLQLWYQTRQKYFCEEWKCRYERWRSEKYDEYLLKLQNIVNSKVNNIIKEYDMDFQTPKFNSCLVNKYRNGNDSIKPHRDTMFSFGEYPTIAGLSLGVTRKFIIKKVHFDVNNILSAKKDLSSNMDLEFELENNSLLIMAGGSQKYFTHEVPKDITDEERYSITFREYI